MTKQKALFLDRDGVINIDHGYVYNIDDFTFSKGIFELLQLFIKKGYLLFIVTNQSGIGRGYYSLDDFKVLNVWMLQSFQKENIEIQSVHYCPHAPEKNCLCRKPKVAMINEILKDNDINLASSWLIGDKQSDIDLAINAKIKNSISIGKKEIVDMSYHFSSILDLLQFLKKNQDKLL